MELAPKWVRKVDSTSQHRSTFSSETRVNNPRDGTALLKSRVSPESPTLSEKFVGLLHLPYLLGCIFVSFVILGPPFQFLANYLTTFDLIATAKSFPLALSALGSLLLFTFVLTYIFYSPHHMRKKILEIETPLSALLPNGEDDFHKLFGRVADFRPQVAIWIAFLAFTLIPFAFSGSLELNLSILGVYWPIVVTLGISSYVWAYVGSLRGIQTIDVNSLKLVPYYQDRTFGLKHLGSLALSLVTVYFGGVMLFLVLFLESGLSEATPISLATSFALFAILAVVGVLMFFLPLRKLHMRMIREKNLERSKLKEKLNRIFLEQQPGRSSIDVSQLLITDMMERKISSLASWPFDIQILAKLIGVVLSVTAILLSTVIRNLLGI